jgi:hypothetical protein
VPDRRVRLTQQLPLVRPTLERVFGLMAEPLRFETNDPALLEAADVAFGRFARPVDGEPLVVRLVVSDAVTGGRPARPPDYHAQGHLLLISGEAGVASVDVERGVASGVVSRAALDDLPLMRYAFIEAMGLSMLSSARGYVTLHAAGVVRDGVGVALLGPAGAGKSTLAMACARRGFGVVAEDAVFVRDARRRVELWGLPWIQRLLPDARQHFAELGVLEPRRQQNGELKLEVDLDAAYPGRAQPCAPAGAVVVLERAHDGATTIERIDGAAALEAIEVSWPYDGGWTAAHERTLARLADGGVYRLRNGGSPDAAVDALVRLVASVGP